jgi:hypothetical protein
MAQPTPEPIYLALPTEVLNQVVETLSARPYKEVAGLMQKIEQSVRVVGKAEAPDKEARVVE